MSIQGLRLEVVNMCPMTQNFGNVRKAVKISFRFTSLISCPLKIFAIKLPTINCNPLVVLINEQFPLLGYRDCFVYNGNCTERI
jgi:hypothetical protein